MLLINDQTNNTQSHRRPYPQHQEQGLKSSHHQSSSLELCKYTVVNLRRPFSDRDCVIGHHLHCVDDYSMGDGRRQKEKHCSRVYAMRLRMAQAHENVGETTDILD